jgi:hypothetical protein
METSHMLGGILAANSASHDDLLNKLDTIIDLLRAEKYAKLD